ncbi:MAG: acyl-CoA thioesterase [Thermoanaerobaculia bacterium]
MSHRFPVAIRFGDFDSAGIVYFPRYLHFCHVGMEEYFAEVLKMPYADFLAGHRLGLPTVRSEVDHRRPIRYGEPVELEVGVERIGASSVHWRHRFLVPGADRPATEARVVTVLVDMSTFEKRDIPDWLRGRFGHI